MRKNPRSDSVSVCGALLEEAFIYTSLFRLLAETLSAHISCMKPQNTKYNGISGAVLALLE